MCIGLLHHRIPLFSTCSPTLILHPAQILVLSILPHSFGNCRSQFFFLASTSAAVNVCLSGALARGCSNLRGKLMHSVVVDSEKKTSELNLLSPSYASYGYTAAVSAAACPYTNSNAKRFLRATWQTSVFGVAGSGLKINFRACLFGAVLLSGELLRSFRMMIRGAKQLTRL
jgi:hypothetical protein